MDDFVAWTPELRADVLPTRHFQNAACRLALLSQSGIRTYPFDDEARSQMRGRLTTSPSLRGRAIAGLANNPAHWRAAIDAAFANIERPSDRTLDIDAEVAAVALELYPLWIALPYWLAEGGIVFALRALIRC